MERLTEFELSIETCACTANLLVDYSSKLMPMFLYKHNAPKSGILLRLQSIDLQYNVSEKCLH